MPSPTSTSAVTATSTTPLTVTPTAPGWWTVTIDNPPINMLDPEMMTALTALMAAAEQEPDLKAIVFESANPDFFMSHVDLVRIDEFDLPGWIDFTRRLEVAPFISISVIRGRARGGGHEFALATDLRYASHERAVLGQPEVGLGIIPGGGGIERMWRLTGKARALEVLASAEDYDAHTAERYGFVNRALPEEELDPFVHRLAGRLASFDSDALATIKTTLNSETPAVPSAEILASQERFATLAGAPHVQARTQALLDLGFQTYGPVELGDGATSGFPPPPVA